MTVHGILQCERCCDRRKLPKKSGRSSLGTRLGLCNIDLEALNLSTMLSNKAKVDKEMDEEEVKA